MNGLRVSSAQCFLSPELCVCVVVVNTPPQRSAPSGFLQKPFALPCPQLNCTALCALAGTSSSNSVCV